MATLASGDLNMPRRPNIVHLSKNLNNGDVDIVPPIKNKPCAPENNLEPLKFDETTSQEENTQEPIIDIVINNVVCSFNVRCHLNLRQIALMGYNVEYRRETGMLTMKLRKPYTTASVWSSGKITCTGATSEEFAKKAARRFTRIFQKLGFRVRFTNFRVVNVLGTCSMPFGIKILQFSQENRGIASYEPELHPGVTYRIKDLKATLKIFSTGSITITAPCVTNVQLAVEHIFPLVYEFRKDLPPRKIPKNAMVAEFVRNPKRKLGEVESTSSEDEKEPSEEDEESDWDNKS